MSQVAVVYGSETPEHSLEIKGLAKSFMIDGRVHPVFAGIDLSIQRGEFVAIVGESGSGKTTLLRIVAGLDAADAGSVTLGGKEVRGVGTECGMVFQEPRLLPWQTVRKNVSLGLELRHLPRPAIDRKVRQFLDLVSLEEFASAYPANCRAAWHSVSGSPERWRPIRKSCCSMNLWAPSTR